MCFRYCFISYFYLSFSLYISVNRICMCSCVCTSAKLYGLLLFIVISTHTHMYCFISPKKKEPNNLTFVSQKQSMTTFMCRIIINSNRNFFFRSTNLYNGLARKLPGSTIFFVSHRFFYVMNHKSFSYLL